MALRLASPEGSAALETRNVKPSLGCEELTSALSVSVHLGLNSHRWLVAALLDSSLQNTCQMSSRDVSGPVDFISERSKQFPGSHRGSCRFHGGVCFTDEDWRVWEEPQLGGHHASRWLLKDKQCFRAAPTLRGGPGLGRDPPWSSHEGSPGLRTAGDPWHR